MTDTATDIRSRLKVLDEKIKSHRKNLELHGLLSHDHHATETELRQRWTQLESEVHAHSKGSDPIQHKAGILENEIHKWIDGTDLDFKS